MIDKSQPLTIEQFRSAMLRLQAVLGAQEQRIRDAEQATRIFILLAQRMAAALGVSEQHYREMLLAAVEEDKQEMARLQAEAAPGQEPQAEAAEQGGGG